MVEKEAPDIDHREDGLARQRATRVTTSIAAALVALALGAGPQAVPADAGGSSRPTGGKAVAHRAGGERVSVDHDARALAYWIGVPAAEPTLGLTEDGTIFYTAADISRRNSVEVLRSKDKGRTWENISPKAGPQNRHVITLDPYIYVDEATGRVFNIDLTVACSYMSYSDDKGASWTTNPLACGRPVNDHHTLFSGPSAGSPTVGYEHIVYYCWNDVASSSCSKSLDGGITFSPTGSPAFAGYDPQSEDEGFNGVTGFCGGLHGHGVVGHDGTIYLPRELCREPWLAISKDEGRTWTRVQIAGNGVNGLGAGGDNPSIDVDRKGNLYYTWIGADRLPYLAVSRDGGKKWTRPMMIGPPGLTEANLITVDAGEPGKLAIAYMGSENSPYQSCRPDCQTGDYAKTSWNGYVAITTTALGSEPVLLTGIANDPKDPLKRTTCGPGRCGSTIFDFIDIVIGRDGTPYAAFVDACVALCASGGPDSGNEGLMVRMVGGPQLR